MSLCSTVISFVPFDIREEKPGLIPPRFFIPKSDMKIPSLLKVETATHFVYLDESRGQLQVKDPSDTVAKAIVEDYCSSQLGVDDNSRPALFWFPEDLTTGKVLTEHKELIDELKRKQRSWFLNITKMADDDWIKYHRHTVISDFQRQIAVFLDLNPDDHEWMTPLSIMEGKTESCPYCSTSIPKGTPVCPTCSNILNYKRKKELDEALMKG